MRDKSVLLVADGRGHILERLGRAWMRYGRFDDHILACSADMHPYEIASNASRGRLVHFLDPLAFARCGGAVSVPQVVMIHHLTEPEIAPMLRHLRYADIVTTSSRRWQKRLAATTPFEPVLIPYSVDASVFAPRNKDVSAARLGIASDRYVIGFSAKASANVNGRKGIDLFLEFLRVAAKVWSDLSVVLIGSGWTTLRSQIEALGIVVAQVEPDRTEDTAIVYPAMDVFLCTSREEGGPCTVLEAMACAVPVVTSDVGHIPEVVEDGRTGFIVPDFSAGGFLDTVRCLRENAPRARTIAGEGRDFILRERDEAVAYRAVDFENIYEDAEVRFRRHTGAALSRRRLSRLALRLRYEGRRAVGTAIA